MLPLIKPDFEYKLQDCFYKYYEADALTRAYTMHLLRTITGDPDFYFDFDVPVPVPVPVPTIKK